MDKLCGNCFVVRNEFSKADYIKCVLLLPFAFLRLACFTVCIFLCWLSSTIAYYIYCLHKPTDYFSKWKNMYTLVPIIFIRFAVFSVGFYTIKYTNFEGDPQAAICLMVPHSSILDFAAVSLLGLPSCVARHQATSAWFFGNLIKLMKPILVNREEAASRQQTADTIRNKATNNELVMLFPEGTCTNREMIIRFRLGAFFPGLPVQAVYLKFNYFDHIDNISWTWEGPSAGMTLLLTLIKWKTEMEIIRLPVYNPNDEEKKNPGLFASNVQKFVAAQVKGRYSFYSYDDVRYLGISRELTIPRSPIGLKFLKICSKIASTITEKSDNSEKPENSEKRLSAGKITIARETIGVEGGSKGSIETVGTTDERVSIEDAVRLVVSNLSRKLNNSTKNTIDSKEDLMDIFEVKKKYPKIAKSTAFDDFFETLVGMERQSALKIDLVVVGILCDCQKLSLWDRVHDCVAAINGSKPDNLRNYIWDDSHRLTLQQFKVLIWYLLGIEESLIVDSVFQDKNITFGNDLENIDYYIKTHINTMFGRAVAENAEDLMSTF